jgi:hypothetical protein
MPTFVQSLAAEAHITEGKLLLEEQKLNTELAASRRQRISKK